MRRRVAPLVGAAVAALVGCGTEDDYANKPRPPAPINVTASIGDDRISVSPPSFGAGPVVFIVTNQSGRSQDVTLATDTLGSGKTGIRQSTGPINPQDTGQIQVNLEKGTYTVQVKSDTGIQPATLVVGAKRKSAQDDLLQP